MRSSLTSLAPPLSHTAPCLLPRELPAAPLSGGRNARGVLLCRECRGGKVSRNRWRLNAITSVCGSRACHHMDPSVAAHKEVEYRIKRTQPGPPRSEKSGSNQSSGKVAEPLEKHYRCTSKGELFKSSELWCLVFASAVPFHCTCKKFVFFYLSNIVLLTFADRQHRPLSCQAPLRQIPRPGVAS